MSNSNSPVAQDVFSAPLQVAAGQLTYRRSYECAAWHTDLASIEQTVIIERRATNPSSICGNAVYVAKIAATVTDDYFQSLFCGNAIGKGYDRTQNVGKADSFEVRFDAYKLLSTPDVILTNEQYDALLAEAIETVATTERYQFKRLEERRGDGAGLDEDGVVRFDWEARPYAETVKLYAKLTSLRNYRKRWFDGSYRHSPDAPRFTTGWCSG